MGALRAGESLRTAHQHDDHRALHRQIVEIVIAGLGQVDAVAGEHQRAGDSGRLQRTRLQHQILAHPQRLIALPAYERHAGTLGQHRLHLETHPLEVTVVAPWSQAIGAEALGHVGGGLLITGASRQAALKVIRGEHLDVAPPGAGFLGRRIDGSARPAGEQRAAQGERRGRGGPGARRLRWLHCC